MAKHSEVKHQVEAILQKYQAARNSDRFLIVALLKEYYHVNLITDMLDPNIPSTETIRRTRQRLQEEGRYLASEEVEQAREDKENVYRYTFL
jgi:hypothetical protein